LRAPVGHTEVNSAPVAARSGLIARWAQGNMRNLLRSDTRMAR